jgi:hypothetical protein
LTAAKLTEWVAGNDRLLPFDPSARLSAVQRFRLFAASR